VLAIAVPLPTKLMLIALVGVVKTSTVAVCANVPLVPVMVSVPDGPLLVVVIVSVEAPALVTAAGLNEAVAPPGNPLTARFTVPVNPFSAAMLTVKVAAAPAVTV
jgi:hypothetical protein